MTYTEAKEFLRKEGYAIILWHRDDILERAKRFKIVLTEQQIKDVLWLIDNKHDATIGVTWETLDYYIEEVYRETNVTGRIETLCKRVISCDVYFKDSKKPERRMIAIYGENGDFENDTMDNYVFYWATEGELHTLQVEDHQTDFYIANIKDETAAFKI